MSTKLKPKQERFCQEYIVDLNATQAAIRSGYSQKTAASIGSENLIKPEIKAKIQELMKSREKRLEITADKVLRDIEECRVRCMQGEEVLDREGHPTGEWKFEAHAALKASELQGKHIKLFTDVIKHEGLENLTDEQLLKRLEELEKKK